MQQQTYTSTTVHSSQIPVQNQRLMSRSEYMQVKNLPIPNPAKKIVNEKESTVHVIKLSQNPIIEIRRYNSESKNADESKVRSQVNESKQEKNQFTNRDANHPQNFSDVYYKENETIQIMRNEMAQKEFKNINDIKIMNSKILNLQEHNSIIVQESQRLHQNLSNKQKEIDNLKQLNNQDSSNIHSELETTRSLLFQQEQQFKKRLDDQNYENQNKSLELKSLETQIQLVQKDWHNDKQKASHDSLILIDKYHSGLSSLLLSNLEIERLLVNDQHKLNQIKDLESQNLSKENNYRYTFENIMQESQQKLKDINQEMLHRESQLLIEIKSLNFKICSYDEKFSIQQSEAQMLQISLDDKQREIENIKFNLDQDQKKNLNLIEITRSQLFYTETQLKKNQNESTTENQTIYLEIKDLREKNFELQQNISQYIEQQFTNEQSIALMESSYKIQLDKFKIEFTKKNDMYHQSEIINFSKEYDFNLKNLQNKIHQYEEQITLIAQENERISNLQHLHQHESDDWKKRYQLISKNLQDQILEITEENLTSKDRLIQILSKVFLSDVEIERLLMKIQELHDINLQQERENTNNEHSIKLKYDIIVSEYQTILNKLRNDVDYKNSQEINKLLKQIQTLEEKFAMITPEIERMNQIINQKDDEIQHQTSQINKLLVTNEQQIKFSDQTLSQEIDQLNNKFNKEINTSQTILKQVQEQNNSFSQELEYLNNLLNQKDFELQKSNIKIQDLINQQQKQVKEYNQEHYQEIEQLYQQNNQEMNIQQRRYQLLDEKLTIFSQDIEVLSQVIRTKEQENDLLKRKTQEMASSYEDQIQYNNSIHSQDLQQLQDQKNYEINIIQKSKLQCEEQLSMISLQVEHFKLLTNQKEVENQRINLKNKDLIISYEDQIKFSNSSHAQEIDEFYSQVEQYTNEINMMQNIQIDIKDIEIRFEAERVAWDSQKNQFQQSILDWENKFKREKESLLNHNQYLEGQLDSQRQNLAQKSKELTDKIKELDQIREKYQSNAYTQMSTTQSQRVSITRQSVMRTNINEQNENSYDVQRSKSSSSVPPQLNSRTPRQAMSILNINSSSIQDPLI